MDIAVHKILEDGAVEEMCAADGGPWGGNSVNKKFVDLLKRCWGRDFIATLQHSHQTQWSSIERSFEQAKRTPDLQQMNQLALLHAGVPVVNLYSKETRKDITLAKDGNLYLNDEYQLMITKSGIDKLFMPTVQHIIDTLRDVTRKVPRTDYMFLVGGFASAQYLTNSIKNTFGKDIAILIPNDPQLTVLRGAVKFGQNPDVIRKRVMTRTYGVNLGPKFDPSRHDLSQKFVVGGQNRCHVFHKLVTVGDHIDINQEIQICRKPVSLTQTRITLYFYETIEKDVMYLDDPSLAKTQGCISVPIPDASEGEYRGVELMVKFGTTEIRARARRRKTPNAKWYHTIVEYSPK